MTRRCFYVHIVGITTLRSSYLHRTGSSLPHFSRSCKPSKKNIFLLALFPQPCRMRAMNNSIRNTDHIAKIALAEKRLTDSESSDVQITSSLAEIYLGIVKQAARAAETWRNEGEADEMRKLIRMLRNHGFMSR